MDGFSIFDSHLWDGSVPIQQQYGYAAAKDFCRQEEKEAASPHLLAGRLYLAKSGWLLLSVPNALVRGVFDAMNVPGANLPTCGLLNVPNEKQEVLNAHISVMTAEEVEKIGAENITERGHMFHYSLGRLDQIPVKNIAGISKVWALQVSAPDLAAVRKGYGLSPYPKDQKFHITIGVRRKANTLKDDKNIFDTACGRGVLTKGSGCAHDGTGDVEEEIAENRVQERSAEEKTIQEIKQAAPSVYLDELRKSIFRYGRPPKYDYDKSVYDNVRAHLFNVRDRGDFRRRAALKDRMAAVRRNPRQAYQIAQDAANDINVTDQVIERFS